jgi:acetolactate synthase-1/2/3 large subunit
LKGALEEMLAYPKSYLLEVAVRMEDNVFPMVPQGKGVSEIVLCKEDM